MNKSTNQIFFGCNYNDKSIKSQFDNLKIKLEKDYPILCSIIDKRGNKSAKDMWVDIQAEIEVSQLCFFDVSAFRPNVVLELGYALAIKNNDQIFITFKERKEKGSKPNWLLSDIGHLTRFPYKNVKDLEEYTKDQIEHMEFMQRYREFIKYCDSETSAPDKYKEQGLKVLQVLRDQGKKTENQIQEIIKGSACRYNKLLKLFKKAKIVARGQGQNGRFNII